MTPSPFISRQDLSDYLGRDVSADAGALIAVDFGCDAVRGETGQEINATTGTFVLDGPGTNALPLPQLPVTRVGTVVLNGGTFTDYVVDTQRGLLIRGTVTATSEWCDEIPTSSWTLGAQNVSVTYEHGWADDDIPRDIRGVALAAAARFLVQGPAISESTGTNSVTYAAASSELTEGERRILRRYKR